VRWRTLILARTRAILGEASCQPQMSRATLSDCTEAAPSTWKTSTAWYW
jgi:hypothetical protein